MNFAKLQLSRVSLILILFLVSSVCGESDSDEQTKELPKIFDYGKYVDQFRKAYSPIETLNKAKLFFGRTLKIFQHNVLFKQNKVNYFLSQNEFTDMTASELKINFQNADLDLEPVIEARFNPNLSASKLLDRSSSGEEEDGFSRSALEDMVEPEAIKEVKPVLNFMDDNQGVEDIKSTVSQLKNIPTDLVDKIAKVVDLKVDESKSEGLSHNNVEYKPVVESNNNNYDPQIMDSFGAGNDMSSFYKNYAKYMMDDFTSFDDFNMDPYPTPATKASSDDDAQESSGGFISGFLSSVKTIFELYLEEEDFDDDELKIVKKPEIAATPNNEKKKPVIEKSSPNDIDWRKTGCISKPKNQKSCNSCYAFTVLSLFEYIYCRQTRKLTDFSSQYIIDCGAKSNLNGCRGGKLSGVGHFIKNYGIELSAMYPYNGKENECSFTNDDDYHHRTGYLRPQITHWHKFSEMSAWEKWIRKTPLIVGVSMPSDFLAYGGGIHDGSDCTPDMVHAMLLVGSGTEKGKEYWLLKNSFSEDWGDAGYFKLAKSAPLRCFVSAVVARAKFDASVVV